VDRNIIISIRGPLAASSPSNMNIKSVHANLLHSHMHCEKRAVTDMFCQHAVIEFLVKEGNLAGVISK